MIDLSQIGLGAEDEDFVLLSQAERAMPYQRQRALVEKRLVALAEADQLYLTGLVRPHCNKKDRSVIDLISQVLNGISLAGRRPSSGGFVQPALEQYRCKVRSKNGKPLRVKAMAFAGQLQHAHGGRTDFGQSSLRDPMQVFEGGWFYPCGPNATEGEVHPKYALRLLLGSPEGGGDGCQMDRGKAIIVEEIKPAGLAPESPKKQRRAS